MNVNSKKHLIVGLFLVAMANIVAHFYAIPDFSYGIILGIGLGFEGLALYGFTQKRNC